jgi:multisubunit Na+/H+ antiporter MnhG subunit
MHITGAAGLLCDAASAGLIRFKDAFARLSQTRSGGRSVHELSFAIFFVRYFSISEKTAQNIRQDLF